MADCTSLISGNFQRAELCSYNPKQGITKAWLCNLSDILKGDDAEKTTTLQAQGTTVRSLFLKDGKKLYQLEGQEANYQATHAFVQTTYFKALTHSFIYRIPYNGETQIAQLQNLLLGAKVVAITKHIDRGIYGDTEFRVWGYEAGLELNATDFDSNANNGTIGFTVASKAGQEESTPAKLLIVRTAGTDDTDGTADDVYTTEATITALQADLV